MGFFTDKWIIAEITANNTILVRKSKKNILLERVVGDSSINSREIITKDVLEEYDLAIDSKNNIYILYQNIEGHLILNVLKDKKKEETKLTSEALSEIFDLNIIVKDKMIHIFYVIRISDEELKYKIYHHYYNGSKWINYVVEDITANKALNPIRLLQTDNSILLLYYRNNKILELMEFSIDKLEWNNKVTLVDTENDKLFLDVINMDEIIHIVYGEYVNESLVIKYNRFAYNDGEYEKYEEQNISNEGSPSHPNILFYENKLWITWVELNKIISRCSEDKGLSWEQNLYMWNQSRDIDFVRYKYLTMIPNDNILLQYSFGSIYPEVTFLGFGPIDNVTEIPIKKKKSMSILRI